jgi:ABC-type sugar transport system ATPase subunit
MSEVLRIEGVTKRYGAVQALRDVSLTLDAGEVVGLVGDNGAGKSTLVGVISGLVSPDEGSIAVDGRVETLDSPARARQLGIETVFQSLSLVPTLDIAENVFLRRELVRGGPLRIMDRRRMRTRVVEGFDRLGLTLPPPHTKVSALSGGQRQAVAIARAVIWGSHIVVMDEPSAALGVKQTEIVLSFVERLKAHGIAVIFISHNMPQVLRVADRMVALRLGQKVLDAPRDSVDGQQLLAAMTGVAINAG